MLVRARIGLSLASLLVVGCSSTTDNPDAAGNDAMPGDAIVIFDTRPATDAGIDSANGSDARPPLDAAREASAFDATPPDGAVASDGRITFPDGISLPDIRGSGDTSPPRDVSFAPDGTLFADAGALGPPEWVHVTVSTDGTCEPLSACGGSVLGTFDLAGVCLDVPIEASLSLCPGARINYAEGLARGRVTFGEIVATRQAEGFGEVQFYIPNACALLFGGCNDIESFAREMLPGSTVTCTGDDAGDCTCTGRQELVLDDVDEYSTSGNQIHGTTSGKSWDYCTSPDGSRIRYEDSGDVEPTEPGIVDLVRRL